MDVIRIGAFELDPSERSLCRAGRPVDVGARAFDLLLVLAEYPGKLVSKAMLLERVWPNLVVEENNLPAQIASLRRVLGAGAIRTVPGYGYRLEAPVSRSSGDAPAPAGPPAIPAAAPRRAGSAQLTVLVGRGEDVEAVEALLAEARLVTIVGAPGVGKTRLAEEILARAAPGSTALVPLAAVASVAQVPSAIALALGLSLAEEPDAFAALDRTLGATRPLLVLDSVEHLAKDLVAPLSRLATRDGGARLLVTSQIPLGIRGEIVYRLAPLAVPSSGHPDDCAASFAAVALFTQRAAAADRNFRLDEASAALVAEICRRLDGNPLALELAAARVPALGLAGLRDRLDDRFRLLKATAGPGDARHGALHAAFEWSHGLLSPAEQRVFNRLGVFPASFSLDAAARCVADPSIDAIEAIDLVGRLVDRSLATALPVDPPRYALPETARYYALERLTTAGELASARANMAAATLHQLDAAYDEYWSMDEAIWLQRFAPEIDNVRAALDWTAEHDRASAVALYGSAWPLFLEADLHAEARERYERVVRLLPGPLPRGRLGRFWEAVATYDSTRQCDRARYAAELSATHAEPSDHRSRYYALMQLALNSRDHAQTAREALSTALTLQDPRWPPRLLMHGALTEAGLYMDGGDVARARDASRRAMRLALSVSERQALAATVRVVELDLAAGDVAAALQLARPLLLTLRHAGRPAAQLELLMLIFSALALGGEVREALDAGAELHALAAQTDPGKLYSVLDAMALLACSAGRHADAARIACYADVAHEAHGVLRRGPIEERLRADVTSRLAAALGPGWRDAGERGEALADEVGACAVALGLRG